LSELEQRAALIRFYFNKDIDDYLSEDFAKAWGQLEFALQFEGKMSVKKIKFG